MILRSSVSISYIKVKCNSSNSTVDILSIQNEIGKLKKQEFRLADLYSKEKITLEQFEEYTAPLRVKVSEFENQIAQANLEKTPKNEILFPSRDEIEVFAQKATQYLEKISFGAKQEVIRTVVNQTTASRTSLQAYGFFNLNEIYVKLFSSDRSGVSTPRHPFDKSIPFEFTVEIPPPCSKRIIMSRNQQGRILRSIPPPML